MDGREKPVCLLRLLVGAHTTRNAQREQAKHCGHHHPLCFPRLRHARPSAPRRQLIRAHTRPTSALAAALNAHTHNHLARTETRTRRNLKRSDKRTTKTRPANTSSNEIERTLSLWPATSTTPIQQQQQQLKEAKRSDVVRSRDTKQQPRLRASRPGRYTRTRRGRKLVVVLVAVREELKWLSDCTVRRRWRPSIRQKIHSLVLYSFTRPSVDGGGE